MLGMAVDHRWVQPYPAQVRMMRSRLPIAVGPAHCETVTSYLSRLATLHAMPNPQPPTTPTRTPTAAERHLRVQGPGQLEGLRQATFSEDLRQRIDRFDCFGGVARLCPPLMPR